MDNRYIPTLQTLFVTALRATVQEDLTRNTHSAWDLMLEETSFEQRVIANFVILASRHYTKEEIKSYIVNELND